MAYLTQKARIFATLVVTLSLSACSSSNQVSSTNQANFSGAELFHTVASLTASDRAALFTKVGTMTFADVYRFLDETTTDLPTSVDGIELSGSHATVVENRNWLMAMASTYKTVGEFWAYLELKPEALSKQDFIAGFAPTSAKLALAAPVTINMSKDCQAWVASLLPMFDQAKSQSAQVALASAVQAAQSSPSKSNAVKVAGADLFVYQVKAANPDLRVAPTSGTIEGSASYLNHCYGLDATGSLDAAPDYSDLFAAQLSSWRQTQSPDTNSAGPDTSAYAAAGPLSDTDLVRSQLAAWRQSAD